MKPITAINNTRYRAVQLTPGDDEAARIVTGWIIGAAGPGAHPEPVLKDAIDNHLYAVRHPSGQMNFVWPAVFLIDFEEVEDTVLGAPLHLVSEEEFGGLDTSDFAEVGEPELTPEEAHESAVKYYTERAGAFADYLEEAVAYWTSSDKEDDVDVITILDAVRSNFHRIFGIKVATEDPTEDKGPKEDG